MSQGNASFVNPDGKLESDAGITGRFHLSCHGPDGKVKWETTFDNLIATAGKNLTLDTLLAGSSYTVTGPFMGLMGAITTGPAAGDTLASHSGWNEAGLANPPTYTAPRKTLAFNAAASGTKSTSAGAVFAVTGTGTVNGAFIALGTGATSTIDNTAGTLYSAGTISPSRGVGSGDTLTLNYGSTLT